jgi:hypothetical protein
VRPIKITVTKGLNQPLSMAFLPDGAILVTERGGRLRIVRNGVLDPTPIAGLPQIQAQGLAGLMDVQLHPRSRQQLIYFTYHKPQAPRRRAAGGPARHRWARQRSFRPASITLAAGRWDGSKLVDVKDLFSSSRRQRGAHHLRPRRHDLHVGRATATRPVGNPDPDAHADRRTG